MAKTVKEVMSTKKKAKPAGWGNSYRINVNQNGNYSGNFRLPKKAS